MSEPWVVEADNFWDTHCVDCSHDRHDMNVCSVIVGGDQNGPDYCPCAIDYPHLAAAYQARDVGAGLDEAEAQIKAKLRHERGLSPLMTSVGFQSGLEFALREIAAARHPEEP